MLFKKLLLLILTLPTFKSIIHGADTPKTSVPMLHVPGFPQHPYLLHYQKFHHRHNRLDEKQSEDITQKKAQETNTQQNDPQPTLYEIQYPSLRQQRNNSQKNSDGTDKIHLRILPQRKQL